MAGSKTFDPATLAQRELAKRLKVTEADALPPGWVAGRIPRPSLPIDECVDQLLRKRRVRTPAALRAVHPLGGCPYALARFAVLRAASHARTQQSYEDELSPSVVAALKYFRDERRFLRGVLSGAERKAKVLVDGLDLLELSLPYQKALHGALSRSRVLIEDS